MIRRCFEGNVQQNILLITLILSAVLLSCAEIAAPPGGDIDRTPPRLISSVPADGTTNVAIDNVVTLDFSEPIVKTSGKRSVYISPRPQSDPKIKIKSNRMQILFADSFRYDQTYVISLMGAIEDLRRNKLDTGTVIAFSTGATIDSGKVSGTVFKQEKGQPGIVVGLYADESIIDQSSLDSLYPLYSTETNSQGIFTFAYLPEHEYRLIAFSDKNKNERFDASIEPYALTDRPVDLSSTSSYDNLLMTLTERDTVKPEIISARLTSDRTFKIRLSKQIDMELLNQFPSNLRLISADSNSITYPAKYLFGPDTNLTSQISCYIDSLNEGVYDLELTYDTDVDPLTYDSLEIEFTDDGKAPTIISFKPDSLRTFARNIDIGIDFDEPINLAKLTDETFTLWDGSDKRLQITRTVNDPASLSFTCDEIKPGEQYRFEITEFDIYDMSDNPLGDSLKTYHFSTYDPDSLGAVSGKVTILNEDLKHDPVQLIFERIGSKQVHPLNIERPEFNIDLPAGKYLLKGFIDSNMNGRYDHGTLFPFVTAETKAVRTDTIQVRARFETSEVIFEIR